MLSQAARFRQGEALLAGGFVAAPSIVKVGDRTEAPNGVWRKVRVRLDDPQRDLTVRVLGLKQLSATGYRLRDRRGFGTIHR